MELKHIDEIERATKRGRSELFRMGMALIFIAGVMLYAGMRGDGQGSLILVVAAMVGGYMAMNIGANDVANNVGPAVGSKAMSMVGALFVAAIFEAAGALIAGGEVVGTIRSGIIDPSRIADTQSFVWLMLAALLAGAMWLNIATAFGAPVSTTHSIVGAVLGAGVAASGFDVVNWSTMSGIVASWVVSPIMGGVIAAAFLYFVKHSITYKPDMLSAARKTLPVLLSLMTWVFATYLLLKGLKNVYQINFWNALFFGFILAVVVFLMIKPMIARASQNMENGKQSINRLFTVPLIFSAALLSFAHGSNDVANAVGPLAAIVDVLGSGAGEIANKAAIPLWVMVVGAIGIAIGLMLFGPKLIRTVGSEITELDQMRAYCIAMSATLTVILASQMGLPISSTHVAVGGVFGVGFLREYIKRNYSQMLADIRIHHPEDEQVAVDSFLESFAKASIEEKGIMLADLKRRAKLHLDPAHFSKMERKELKNLYRQELVKRSQLLRIGAAWVITVPASALMAWLLYFTIRGMMI